MSYEKCLRCKEYGLAPCKCKSFLVAVKEDTELDYKETKDYSEFSNIYAKYKDDAVEKYVEKYISDEPSYYVDSEIEVIVIDGEEAFEYSVTPQVDIIYNIKEL